MDQPNNSAEAVGLQAVSFIISDDTLRDRFIAISGVDPDSIRTLITQPEFLINVLDFLIQHEPDLIDFASETNLPPESVVKAWRQLGGGVGQEW